MEQTPKRGRGRPSGQFNQKKESVYKFLKDQQEHLGNTDLHVSNKHVADVLGVCERQASRYITALQKEGRIQCKVRRFEFTPNSYSNIRIVTIVEANQ